MNDNKKENFNKKIEALDKITARVLFNIILSMITATIVVIFLTTM